ncbi:MAG: hypothetical protein V3V08_08350 [Nannocystaceae bacterium]
MLFALSAGFVACESGSAGDPPEDGLAASDQHGEPGACRHDVRLGGVLVDVHPEFPSVSGSIADGVVPASVFFLVEGSELGECRLEKRILPFCEETCTFDQLCNFDEVCVDYPENHSVGTLTLEGLSVPVRIDPLGEPGAIRYSFVDLQTPVVVPGDEVVVRASGDDSDFDGFTLRGRGVDSLAASIDKIVLRRDADCEVSWDAGVGDAHITIVINIDQHGASPIRLFCDTVDKGSLMVPKSLIGQLMDAGTTGFPSMTMTRRTVEWREIEDVEDGCIEFEVSSSVNGSLLVDGHIPCNNDADCPDDMICDESIQSCVDNRGG